MSSVTPPPLPASYTAVRPYTATLEMWTRRAPARRAASIASRVPPTFTRVYSSRDAGVTTSAAPCTIASTPAAARSHEIASVTSPITASAPNDSTSARECARTRARGRSPPPPRHETPPGGGGNARARGLAVVQHARATPRADACRRDRRHRSREWSRRAGAEQVEGQVDDAGLTTAGTHRRPDLHLAADDAEADPAAQDGAAAIGQPGHARDAADVALFVGHGAPPSCRRGRWIGLKQEPAQVAVGMTTEVQPAHRLLTGITSLCVRHAADFVESHFLRNRLLIDFSAESRPARENARELEC